MKESRRNEGEGVERIRKSTNCKRLDEWQKTLSTSKEKGSQAQASNNERGDACITAIMQVSM